MTSPRLYYRCDELDGSDVRDTKQFKEVRQPCSREEANLVGSLCEDGFHRPALDIDLPCELVPSSTPGHFHLYIDLPIAQEPYVRLVEALAEVGIVSRFYAEAARARGQTFLRPPWVKKTPKEPSKIAEGT